MERALAWKKLRKLLGSHAGFQVNPKACDANERAAAKAALPALVLAKESAAKDMRKRREELLADPAYQVLVKAYEDASKEADRASGAQYSFKFTAGISRGMFFEVRAQGDSWEEVITKLEKKPVP